MLEAVKISLTLTLEIDPGHAPLCAIRQLAEDGLATLKIALGDEIAQYDPPPPAIVLHDAPRHRDGSASQQLIPT